jgi:hypothetical protein
VTGPVQVLVLGFAEPTVSGAAVAELVRLREAGAVRLVDLLLLSRDEDGSLVTLPAPPGADPTLGELATALLGVAEDDEADAAFGRLTEDESWSLDDVVPEHGSAAVALVEHTWAAPLVDAVRAAGGSLLDETWLARADVERVERVETQR